MPVPPAHQQQDAQRMIVRSPRTNDAKAARLANAETHARRNSCCVAHFADVALSPRASDPGVQRGGSTASNVHERGAEPAPPARTGGNIDHETRSAMQQRFSADFGGVRLHAAGGTPGHPQER